MKCRWLEELSCDELLNRHLTMLDTFQLRQVVNPRIRDAAKRVTLKVKPEVRDELFAKALVEAAIVAVLVAKRQLTGTLFISDVCTTEFIETSMVWHMESCGYEIEGFDPEDRRRLIR